MAAEDRVRAVVTPITDDLGLELVDLTYGGGRLKVTIDHPDGLDTQMLTAATRAISVELDETDPIAGGYTLEVSSPGVERPLRLPEHYIRSIGEQVSLKLRPNDDNLRRVKGELMAADDESVTVRVDGEDQVFDYESIAKAKTIFDWGPAPKPGGPKGGKGSTGSKNSKNKQSTGPRTGS